MNTINKLDGQLFEKLIIGGAINLRANVKEVNELNVFPIPDGDTGDNMYMTINGGIEYLKKENDLSLSKKALALANGMMLSARGNSGVILSQLFNGLAKGLEGIDSADVLQMCNAFKQAVKQAYSAVVKPVEGTMLTVAREAVEYTEADKAYTQSINDFFKKYLSEMKKSLDRTPELLETLKEAEVIDSGGAGLVYIIEGIKEVLEGKEIVDNNSFETTKQTIDFSKFNENSVMEYGYCTEFLLQLQTSKIDINNFDIQVIIDYLNAIGDSIVAYLTGTVVKIHVHTLQPYKALEFCQKFGEFLTVKIENMTLQHNEVINNNQVEEKKIKRPKKKYGIVAVANGEGLINTLIESGVDEVINGGQTNNPSTKLFLEAFERVNAEYIYVFPNNSNIIMTANEAKQLYEDSIVYVIKTKDFGQAYSALSVADFGIEDPEEIRQILEEAKDNVVTGLITKSIRDANINNVDIHEGDFIGLCDKTMHTSKKNKLEAYFELIKKMDVEEKSFLINIYGKDVSNSEKQFIETELKEKYPNLEIYSINGEQEVYDLMVVLE